MIIYLDTEFTGLHREALLLSIAMVTDEGHEFYGEVEWDNMEFARALAHPSCNQKWIKTNVLPSMVLQPGQNIIYGQLPYSNYVKGPITEIKAEAWRWLTQFYDTSMSSKKRAFFVTDVGAYDWVFFIDLVYARADQLPSSFDYIARDLATLLECNGYNPDCSRREFVNPQDWMMEPSHPIYDLGDWDNLVHNALIDARTIKAVHLGLSKAQIGSSRRKRLKRS